MLWFLGLILFIGIIMAGLIVLIWDEVKDDNIFYGDDEPCDGGPCSACRCKMRGDNND